VIWLVLLGTAAGAVSAWLWSRATGAAEVRRGQREAGSVVAEARRDAAQARAEAEVRAREDAASIRAEATQAASRLERDLERVRTRLARRQTTLAGRHEALGRRRGEAEGRRKALAEKDAAARGARDEVRSLQQQWATGLERVSGASTSAVRAERREALVEEARSDVARALHEGDQALADSASQDARRLMTIAAERLTGHYLTERSMFHTSLNPGEADALRGPGGAYVEAIEAATGATLAFSETGDALRIEGPDGVAREAARRALQRFARQPQPVANPQKLAQQVTADLDREIDTLGRKAFDQLKIPRPHAEIVKLVGRLNWRTSYTQNQWKHAVEAAQLASMIAAEIGLDAKVARRGALMHDIGKSLTPQVEGSHALIGAEIARRRGEMEIVANAIGAHHAEEPCNTPYASLVAGTDAMSGGRPGARREATMVEAFGRRVEEMEKIAVGFRGVDHAFALGGGRELRVYVRENVVDDTGVARLSGEIAAKIAADVVFPGQVKVTVIRELRAAAVAR
jgi:ribonuclease Y